MDNVFAHTIGRADFIGGVIRCELNTIAPNDAPGGDGVKVEATHAVYMPLDGFLRAYATLEDLVQKLAAAGVIRPGGAEGAAPTTPPPPPGATPMAPAQAKGASAAATPPSGTLHSPNFD